MASRSVVADGVARRFLPVVPVSLGSFARTVGDSSGGIGSKRPQILLDNDGSGRAARAKLVFLALHGAGRLVRLRPDRLPGVAPGQIVGPVSVRGHCVDGGSLVVWLRPKRPM